MRTPNVPQPASRRTAHGKPAKRRAAARLLKGSPAASDGAGLRKIGILIADQEGVFLLGLKRLLAAEDDLKVVAEIIRPEDIVPQARELQPDVLFVQFEMLTAAGQNILGAIRQGSPKSKVVVTASELTEVVALDLMKAGARGVILRIADPSLFVKCARKIDEGEIWLPKKQVAAMARELSEPSANVRPVDTLTDRERLVMSCLLQGWRNREIARHLSITEQTVKNHLRSVYDKVGVSDRVELVLYVIHRRLELPPIAAGAMR